MVGSGERSASPPPNPKRTHNYMFPVLFTTQNNTTQTDVLGLWPSHGGLFTCKGRSATPDLWTDGGQVIDDALECGPSAYDAEFVVLARTLGGWSSGSSPIRNFHRLD